MSEVLCHGCEKPCAKNEFSRLAVWVGVIEAKKELMPHCFDCLAQLRMENEESNNWEREGEDWRPAYNPDHENGEEWKTADE